MKIFEVAVAPTSPIFYSGLQRSIGAIQQPRASGQQWVGMIRNLVQKGGAKQAEVDYSGVLPWLGQQGNNPVTKDQILQHLSARYPDVQTTIHGPARDQIAPDEQAGLQYQEPWQDLVRQKREHEKTRPSVFNYGSFPDEAGQGFNDPYEEWVKRSNDLDDQMDALHAKMVNDTMARQNLSGQASKYSGYRLPGGKDYREMLLSVPPGQLPLQIGHGQPPGFEDYGNKEYAARWGSNIVQGVTEYPFQIGSEKGRITFWPISYDDFRGKPGPPKWTVNSPNMQNAKFDSFEDAKAGIEDSFANGYIGQARRDVYKHGHWPGAQNVLAHSRFDMRTDAQGNNTLHVAEIQSDLHQAGRKTGYRGDPVELTWTAQDIGDGDRRRHIQLAYNDKIELGFVEQVTPATWYAYDNHGRIGDFRTEEEAKAAVNQKANETSGVPNLPFKKEWPGLVLKRLLRYAVDHGVDRITWDVGQTHAKRFDLANEVNDVVLHGSGDNLRLSASDKRNRKIIDMQHVTPNTLPDYVGKEVAEKLLGQPEPDPKNPYAARSLHGLDLKVGGEGMAGFYDQILPSMVNKYARKYGGAVTQTRIVATPPAEAEGKTPRPRYAPAWELVITPQMRDAVLQGQPLWESLELP